MRDAQSLLDQIISFSGQEVVDDDVRDVLGFIPNEILDRTTRLHCVAQLSGTARNSGNRHRSGLEHSAIRPGVHRPHPRSADDETGPRGKGSGQREEKTALARRAEAFSEQDLIRFFDMLLRLESELRWTSQPRFHLEVGLVKLAKIGHVRDIEDVLEGLKSRDSAGPSVVVQKASRARRARPAQPARRSAQDPTSCGIRHRRYPKAGSRSDCLPCAPKPPGPIKPRVHDAAAATVAKRSGSRITTAA